MSENDASFTVSDVSILNPRHRFHATAISLTRLLKRFNNNSTCDIDAVLMEFREYKSLLESHLPACNDSLEQFWNSMGKIPLPAGEATAISASVIRKSFARFYLFYLTLQHLQNVSLGMLQEQGTIHAKFAIPGKNYYKAMFEQ